mgnify:CR=1 FL=1
MNGLKTDTIINRDALYALRELQRKAYTVASQARPTMRLGIMGLICRLGGRTRRSSTLTG